ncbi:MAG TPA: Spy/CpxP family protein refolding chaperone [Terriglobales bacterium]|nr:Spy/CpxP family protein refolding chaperone [Terriglobales bacterium]
MKKTISVLLFTCLLTASLLFAQNPTPPDPATRVQHHVSFLTTALSLTPAQQSQATTIFTSDANNQSALHDSLKTAHQNLDTAIKNNDSAGIEQASTTIGNLTAQLTSAHAKAQAAFYQVLNTDQQTKLSQMHSQHHFGFGGPPHFGGGPGPASNPQVQN